MFIPPEKVILDVLVIGWEEDKEKLGDMFGKMQTQLDELNRTDLGVLFGLGKKEEDNIENIKEQLIKMTVGEYYYIYDAREVQDIMPNFFSNLMQIVAVGTEEDLKPMGIIKK